MLSKSIQNGIKYIKQNQARIIGKYKVNIFKRQSVCILSFIWPSNMDFEDLNFGLQFTRLTLVDLFGDDSIAQKLYKENIWDRNEL